MKLNNHGWGLNFLLVIGSIFLLILIVVSFKIRSMTNQVKKENKKSNETSEKTTVDDYLYTMLEQTLKKSGDYYVVYHTTLVDNISDHAVVTFETLKNEGFIESLADPNGEGNCQGYVFIKNDGSVQPFIKCADYETLNYSLWVD